MKVKKLLCIVLSLAAVFSLLLIRDTAAWLDTHTGSSPSGTIRVDKMAFSFDGALGTHLRYTSGSSAGQKYVVTEQNLIVTNGGKITVTNYSTIKTEARFTITYQAINTSTHQKETRTYRAAETDSLLVTVGSDWVRNGDYFYYMQPLAEGASERVAGFPANNVGTSVSSDAITNIEYRDSLFINGVDVLDDSDYFPFSGEVHVIFEAKQEDNVNWTQITDWATPTAL